MEAIQAKPEVKLTQLRLSGEVKSCHRIKPARTDRKTLSWAKIDYERHKRHASKSGRSENRSKRRFRRDKSIELRVRRKTPSS